MRPEAPQRSLLQRLLSEPLVVFMFVGAAFFGIASLIRPPDRDERQIVVDRAAILKFIQYRSKAFEPATAARLLDSLSEADRQALVEDYVREEVLYREAKALGLDGEDYVIKQRLIQKFEFAAEAAIADDPPTDEEVQAWFEAHTEDYVEPAAATFTHVFYSNEKRGPNAAEAAAENAVLDLVKARAPFEAAAGKGDRFPFGVNYVERTYDYVASQFGDAAAQSIFSTEGPFNAWRGPIVSSYGAHAILVRKVKPARTPALQEVYNRVAEDVARDRRSRAKAALVAAAVGRYDVKVRLGPAAPPPEPDADASP